MPGLLHAERMFAGNRRNAGVIIGDVTMGVDHYAVQGALAAGAAGARRCSPPSGRAAGASSASPSVSAPATSGLVSFAFPGDLGRAAPLGSALCMAWGAAVAVLALAAPRLQPRELRREVVETQ